MATSQNGSSVKNEDATDEVVSVNEVHRLIDLGLGRGVDATNPRPWKYKSSFQVREISPTLANIIGTDEGGAHQYYNEEISSVHSTQLQAKMSVEVPSTCVSLSIDGEYSRSTSKTRIAVGEKVVTRTISFRADFDDLPLNSMTKGILEMRMNTPKLVKTHQPMTEDTPTIVRGPTEPSIVPAEVVVVHSFEAKLSAWLLDHIQARQERDAEIDGPLAVDGSKTSTKDTKEVPVQSLTGNNPIQKLTEYIRSIQPDSEQMQNMAQDCYEFVTLLGLTHYVYAIHLGAVSFETYTQAEFNSKVSSNAKLGAGNLGIESIVGGATHTAKDQDKSLHKREIGKIESDKTVKRKPGDEAVIKIQMKPIHTLVHLNAIHLAMQRALSTYINERADKSEGPFLIACADGDNRIYWKVNKANQVVGVKDVTAASIFYASQFDDPQHPYEFFIEYYGEDDNALKRPRGIADPMSKTTSLAPLAKFLDTTLSTFGKNPGPLVLTSEVHKKNVRLTLHSRFVGTRTPFSVKSWTEGEEYFIRCSRRRFKVDGYITMNPNPSHNSKSVEGSSESFEFITAIVPSVKNHNTQMLFRLLPSEYRRFPSLAGESESRTKVRVSGKFEELFGTEFLFNHEKQHEREEHID